MTVEEARQIQAVLQHALPHLPEAESDQDKDVREAAAKLAKQSYIILPTGARKIHDHQLREQWKAKGEPHPLPPDPAPGNKAAAPKPGSGGDPTKPKAA